MIPNYKIAMVRDGSIPIRTCVIKHPDDAIPLIQAYLKGLDREAFVAIALTTRNTPLGINTVALGSLESCIVHPREVFKFAILANASALLFAHNHPSGDTAPSEDDIKLTKRLHECGELLGIEVIDHLIIAPEGGYTSLKERQIF